MQRRMLLERLLDHRRHERRLQHLTERRKQLVDDRAAARERAGVAGETLEAAQRGIGRLSRRDEIAAARRNLAHANTAIADMEEQLDQIEAQLCQARDEERAAEVRADVAAYEAVNQALDEHVQRTVQATAFAPPTYILRAIGERPDQPSEREAWQRSIAAIERYRLEWSIDDPDRALGEPPREVSQKIAYRRALESVMEGREWLRRGSEREEGRAVARDLGLSR